MARTKTTARIRFRRPVTVRYSDERTCFRYFRPKPTKPSSLMLYAEKVLRAGLLDGCEHKDTVQRMVNAGDADARTIIPLLDFAERSSERAIEAASAAERKWIAEYDVDVLCMEGVPASQLDTIRQRLRDAQKAFAAHEQTERHIETVQLAMQQYGAFERCTRGRRSIDS